MERDFTKLPIGTIVYSRDGDNRLAGRYGAPMAPALAERYAGVEAIR